MQPEFIDFPNCTQGFGFTGREAISEARKFSKTHQMGVFQGCDTGVGMPLIQRTFERNDRDCVILRDRSLLMPRTGVEGS